MGAAVGPLPRVQALVELEVDVLGEAGRARLALVGALARAQPLVGLEVAGAAEALVAHLCWGIKRGLGIVLEGRPPQTWTWLYTSRSRVSLRWNVSGGGGGGGRTLHWGGFSPVGTRKCFCRWASWVKSLVHV